MKFLGKVCLKSNPMSYLVVSRIIRYSIGTPKVKFSQWCSLCNFRKIVLVAGYLVLVVPCLMQSHAQVNISNGAILDEWNIKNGATGNLSLGGHFPNIASGTVTVSGSDTTITYTRAAAYGYFEIGRRAGEDGTLQIDKGARFNIRGRQADARNSTRIGESGKGTLKISNANSVFNAYNLYLGVFAGSSGSVVVSDGGKLDSTGSAAGGLTSQFTYIGASGDGDATVTGLNSKFIAHNLDIGRTGRGVLTITDNGSVVASGNTVVNVGNNGTGLLTIQSGGKYTGITVFNVGKGATSTGIINIGGMVDAAGQVSVAEKPGTLEGSPTINFGLGTASVNFNHTAHSNDPFIFDSVISGGSITNSHVDFYSGSTVLNKANSYTGTTTVHEGASLQIGISSELSGSNVISGSVGTGALVLKEGASIQAYGGARTVHNAIKLGTAEGMVTVTGTEDITLAGNISGTGNLKIATTGNVTISNSDNSYTGNTTVFSGTATAGATSVFGSGTMRVESGATLNLGNYLYTLKDLSGAGTVKFGNTLTLNNDNDNTFSGLLKGSNSALIKTGAGELTLGGNNSVQSTAINAGSIKATNAGALGTGSVTIAQNTHLNLAFDADTFTNSIKGVGTVKVTGNNVELSGNNTLSGQWDITGSAKVSGLSNLGTAAVKLDGTSSNLNLISTTTGDIAFTNVLTGTGTLETQLQNASDAFSFTTAAGNAFAGTLAMRKGSFDLGGNNTTALTHAMLEVGSDSVVTVATGNQQIGGLSFNGGTVIFDVNIPAQTQANGIITAQNLDLNGNGTIKVSVLNTLSPPVVPANTNLLDQDSLGAFTKLAELGSGGSLVGGGSGLSLIDQNGDTISNGKTAYIYDGTSKVVTGTYDFRLTSGDNEDGLYVNYGLKQVDIDAGKTLTLRPDAGATGASTDLSATVTGSGHLEADAGSGNTVSLTSASNNYTGTTSVTSGTLQLGSHSALGLTSELIIKNGTVVDMNGWSQSIGALNTEVGSKLNLTGTLTIADAQRTAGDRSGGFLVHDSLLGNGTFVIDPSIMRVNGSQLGYTGKLEVVGGSELLLNTVNAFDNAQGINLVGVTDKVVFGDMSDFNAIWTNIPNGSTKANFSGLGAVELKDGANVNLTGNSSNFSGTFDIAVGTRLTAKEAKNIGTATIQLNGNFTANANNDWLLQNVVTGTGTFEKTGSGIMQVNRALSGFIGLSKITDGVLIVGDGTTNNASIGGTVEIGTMGVLSGTGNVNGSVLNQGRIVAYNALPSSNGHSNDNISQLSMGALTNSGVVQLAGTAVGNTLTIRGGLTGMAGSEIIMNAVLGNDASLTDKVILDGGHTTGITGLTIINQGGIGGKTNAGILIVDTINGATTDIDAFKLTNKSASYRSGVGTLAIGAYDYSLVHGGTEGWYLTSNGNGVDSGNGINAMSNDSNHLRVRPEAGIYGANLYLARTMFTNTLNDRDAQLQGHEGNNERRANVFFNDHLVWTSTRSSHSKWKMASDSLSTSADIFTLQFGADVLRRQTLSGAVYIGLMGGVSRASTHSDNKRYHLDAKGKVTAYSAGVYGTWYQNDKNENGLYLDSTVQYIHFKNSVEGKGLAKERYNAATVNLSLEGGYRFILSQSQNSLLTLEPQLQLIYSGYRANDHVEISGTRIGFDQANALQTRAGARLYGEFTTDNGLKIRPFIEANYWYNQNSGKLIMNQDTISINTPRSYGELKLGGIAEVGKNLQVWGELGVQKGNRNFSSYSGQVGIKYSW